MNVWTIAPRCAGCRRAQSGVLVDDHKMSCAWLKGWYWGSDLPRRDPGRSIQRPWLAKWPKDRKQVKLMKSTKGHVIPSKTIVHVGPNVHAFNGSDGNAYIEVTESGEVRIAPLKSGQVIIQFAPDN